MVNWKQVAEDDLRKYESIRAAADNNRQQIALLEDELRGVKAIPVESGPHSVKVSGDESINRLVMKMELEEILARNEQRLKLIEKGLEGLDREERLALEYFYINHRRNAADSLCEELCVERTTAYKIRGQALHKYIVRAYGLV